MGKGKKKKLTASDKSGRVLQRLVAWGWILDYGFFPINSLEDSVGRDAWIVYRYNGHKQGKFAYQDLSFQILSKNSQGRKHKKKHFGVPHIAIGSGDTIRDATLKYLLFLFAHNALNADKLRGLDEGMSMLCPLKCKNE